MRTFETRDPEAIAGGFIMTIEIDKLSKPAIAAGVDPVVAQQKAADVLSKAGIIAR